MNNKLLQILIRFIKENNLYNKNDVEQCREIKLLFHKAKNGHCTTFIKSLYSSCEPYIFHYKKTIEDFESFMFIQLFNKTPTEILDEYLKNKHLYNVFYKRIKESNRTINLRRGVGNTIGYSFCWDNTKEGYDFWDNEDRKLKNYINNIISEKIQ